MVRLNDVGVFRLMFCVPLIVFLIIGFLAAVGTFEGPNVSHVGLLCVVILGLILSVFIAGAAMHGEFDELREDSDRK